MNAKVFVAYEKGKDYDPKSVRPGPKGGTAPEFKCFNCNKISEKYKEKYVGPGEGEYE